MGPGSKVFNRFALQRELGRGGMGVVWLARDESLQIDVALKFLPGMISRDDEALADLRQEIRRGLHVTHAGVVRVFDLHEARGDGLAAIAMQYVDGPTLRELKQQQPDRCFDAEQLFPWVEQICGILSYVHEEARIVHRDIKPHNLMLTSLGRIKIADFGLAETLSESYSRVSRAKTSGTPAYMSPQQARGVAPSPSDDLYAVGATLYELFTGKPPFFRGGAGAVFLQHADETAPSMAQRREEFGIFHRAPIPPEWELVVAACLAKEPEGRPASAREIARRLAGCAEGSDRGQPYAIQPVEQESEPSYQHSLPVYKAAMGKTRKPKKIAYIAVIAISLFAIASLAKWWFGIRRTENDATHAAAQATNGDESAAPKVSPAPSSPTASNGSNASIHASDNARSPDRTSTEESLPSKEAAKALTSPAPSPPTPTPKTEMEKWLEQVDAQYQEPYQREVQKPYEASLAQLAQSYLASIDRLLSAATQAANLEDAVALRSERQRVVGGLGVPENDSDSPQTSIKLLRAGYRAQASKFEKARTQGAALQFERYDKVLAAAQAQLTQHQRLDDALLLNAKRKQIASAWLGNEMQSKLSATQSLNGVVSPNRAIGIADNLAKATKDNPFVNSLGIELVPVSIAGGPTDSAKTGVRILFARTITTVTEYGKFVEATAREWPKPNFAQGFDEPAVNVSWEDAVAFCDWLTAGERKAGRLPADAKYRLPSDHEWSCAVGIGGREDPNASPDEKLGKIGGYPWGESWPPPKGVGNYADQSAFEAGSAPQDAIIAGYRDGYPNTSPVRAFRANELGLHDMGGNVWQWCMDQAWSGSVFRVLRGASWLSYSYSENTLRSSYRREIRPTSRDEFHGFRCVVEAGARKALQAALPVRPAVSALAISPLEVQRTRIGPVTKDTPFVNSLGMEFVPIRITGGATDTAKTEVRLLFSRTITTVAEYSKFVQATGRDWPAPVFKQDPDHPAVNVSRDDAGAFCDWLTARERPAGKLPPGAKYRLPSDHEWSCAAGIGDKENSDATPTEKTMKVRDYPWGKVWPPPREVGNYADESGKDAGARADRPIEGYRDGYPFTSPVRAFHANKSGLYDMGGNVWQWCSDPFGSGSDSAYGVARGASWFNGVEAYLRSSCRFYSLPSSRYDARGFRCIVETAASDL